MSCININIHVSTEICPFCNGYFIERGGPFDDRNRKKGYKIIGRRKYKITLKEKQGRVSLSYRMELIAETQFKSSKTCFVDFSEELRKFQENEIKGCQNLLDTPNKSIPLSIKCCGGHFITSWSGRCFSGSEEYRLYIDREFATYYRIEDNSNVHIKFISEHIPAAHQVTVSPCKKADWEILVSIVSEEGKVADFLEKCDALQKQLNSCHIENVLLHQISFVEKGLIFPLHLNESTVVFLKVVSTNPHGIVLLQEDAEVIIEPFNESREETMPVSHQVFGDENKYLDVEYSYINQKQSHDAKADKFLISKVIKFMNFFVDPRKDGLCLQSKRDAGCKSEKRSGKSESSLKGIEWELQIQSIPLTLCDNPVNEDQQTSPFSEKRSTLLLMNNCLPPYQGVVCENVFKEDANHRFGMLCSYFEVGVKPVLNETNEKKQISSDSDEVKLVLQVKILPLCVWNEVFDFADYRILYVNPLVIEQLQTKVGTKVLISCFEESVDDIQGIVLHCETSDHALHQQIKETFSSSLKSWSAISDTTILNQGTLFKFKFNDDYKFGVGELIGVTRNICGKIDNKSLKDVFVHVENDESKDNILPIKCSQLETYDFSKFTSDIVEHFRLGFRSIKDSSAVTPLINNQPIVLIHGKSLTTSYGCGKTLISRAVANYFSQHPYFWHVEYIDCILLRGKKISSIYKHWVTVFETAFLNEPSIMIFDDLDELITNVDVIQDGFAKDEYSERLGDLFHSFVESIFNGSKRICIIATATSLESLHSSLLPQLNSHLFTKLVCVSDISFDHSDMLDRFIHDFTEKRIGLNIKPLSNVVNSKELANKLANCNLKTFNSITQRTLQSKLKNMISCDNLSERKKLDLELNLTASDIEKNLETFDSLLMNDLKINKPKTVLWEDIGGLEFVKETLKETLLWPVIYPELLSQCPLRLCSGVLLYGAPGTAKTMLASAVAYESNLNFISVKGPELLSKYIGSSESNVRDLFARAESAKPCIIFFDELESIAPRRGHDNTGVTDRVVNQLLTQLDGVESLNGVFVLAATSRPDLVDPALLRPGRFDKSIHCPMPSEQERIEILSIILKEIKTDADINFELLSASTAGFSGADLKALVYNAQVDSAHEYLKTLKDGIKTDEDDQVQHCGFVTMNHFTNALQTTQPSVSSEEKKKYIEIFENFSSQHNTDNAAGRIQKVTLA